ncbi:MAG: hypothetical protein R3C26_21220 [Calditrichia bacterium]
MPGSFSKLQVLLPANRQIRALRREKPVPLDQQTGHEEFNVSVRAVDNHGT